MMMMMGFWLIVPLLLIGAVVAFVLGLRPQTNQTGSAPANQTPVEILKARYARDEISREEYEQRRRDLES